jgi:hypothetical protein
MTLTRGMIEHRATVFEENSVIFMKRHGINGVDDFSVARGYRATWARRVDLCLSKLASRIHSGTPPGKFAGILLTAGRKPEDDEFIEVHIWGPLTIRSFQRVAVKKWTTPPSRSERLAVKAGLDKLGVKSDFP